MKDGDCDGVMDSGVGDGVICGSGDYDAVMAGGGLWW